MTPSDSKTTQKKTEGWTLDKPSEEGYYWAVHPESPDGIRIVRIVGSFERWLKIEGELYPGYYDGFIWNGPIPPPEIPST